MTKSKGPTFVKLAFSSGGTAILKKSFFYQFDIVYYCHEKKTTVKFSAVPSAISL